MSDGSIGAGLTDEELGELHDILFDHCCYGDDDVVYGSAGDTARRILKKVDNEAKARGFWWAR